MDGWMDGWMDLMKSIISVISAHHTFNILFLHLFVDFFCLFPSAAGGERMWRGGRGGGGGVEIELNKNNKVIQLLDVNRVILIYIISSAIMHVLEK